jgi:PAS domain S-box-containing protein
VISETSRTDETGGLAGGHSQFRTLAQAMPNHVWTSQPDGMLDWFNEQVFDYSGETLATLVGTGWASIVHPDDLVAAAAQWQAALISGNKYETEFRLRRADGAWRWHLARAVPIRDATGRITRWIGTNTDVDDRKNTEAWLERQVAERTVALTRSEEQFRLLVQGVTDYAIYMLDATGNVSSWNAGAERIKGYRPAEVIGSHFSRFYTPEDRATGLPERALETASRVGRFEKEGWRVRKDGSRFWAHVVIDAIRTADGKLLGFAKVTRDITERREAQLELERTRDQLLQSLKMEAIGNLTGGIAHDFNNLLMAVLGSLELLRKRLPDDPALLKLLDNAVEGANRGSALTRRMLAFARRQELTSERIDAATLVDGMRELMQRSLGPMVAIETSFPLELAPIEADPNQLESALLNLAVNARDAMNGEGRIVISGRQEELASADAQLPAGRYIVVSIADSGEGMDEETLKRATEPFFTTKGIGKGTGLGVSMVLGLAQQSGGTLKLRSAPGKGTTAEIWLPAASGKAEALPVPARVEPAATLQPRRSLKVLAVDDDALVLMNTSAMLAELGHEVTEAYSARDALKSMEAGGYDLVITDHAMPQMTGAQLSARIRERWPGIPIILATGYAELPPDADQGLPRISKPFSEADLARVVDQVTRAAVLAD